jgi:hypothetical protein
MPRPSQVSRPTREPALSFPRNVDGMLVEVWVTKHTRRSHDRALDGTTYYRAMVAIGGVVHDHMPQRYDSESAALRMVREVFGVK